MKTNRAFYLLRVAAITGLLVLAAVARAQITINLAVGVLTGHDGQPLPDGRLIQLVASTTDASFTSPTTTAFTGGDDVIIASFPLQSATLQAGGFVITIPVGGFPNLNMGDPLLLRWYDTDYLSNQSAPGTVYYGEFRTNDMVHGSDISWFLPGENTTVALGFLTQAIEGPTGAQESAGLANLSTIPEPSTYALAAGGLALLVAGISRRHGQKGGNHGAAPVDPATAARR